MNPKIVRFCNVEGIEIKDKDGVSLIAIGEKALDAFYNDKMIDNLDYIEALVFLRQKLKEK